MLELMIESRDRTNKTTRQNKTDHAVIIEARRRGSLAPKTPYSWVGKEEPLVWFADTAAGIATCAVLGDASHLVTLAALTEVAEHRLALP